MLSGGGYHVCSLFSHALPMISDADNHLGHDAKLCSIISLCLPLPTNNPIVTTHSSFLLLMTYSKNVQCLFLMNATNSLCRIFITVFICPQCTQHLPIKQISVAGIRRKHRKVTSE